ncbi:MAG TPA: hypothetical protein VEH10_01845 [Thermoplasmata archaeon]|nr:hypothetical protein [Thermoplasmata archaeon]
MSDIRAGWAELISAPLGAEPPDPTPLAVLPCVFDLARTLGRSAARRSIEAEP